MTKTIDARELAKYLIKVESQPDFGEYITNLKLQKILYYIQGFHLAFFDKPIFHNEIQAWMYGPVVKDVYDVYKNNGASGITELYQDEDLSSLLNFKQQNLVSEVWKEYGQYSASKLVEMTHEESPWSVTTDNGKNCTKSKVIPLNLMKEYFLTQID